MFPPALRARNEANAAVSPDGRWLAYASDESGQYEVYVRPFPDTDAGKWPVSSGGGDHPLWSHDGAELFYMAPEEMMAVSIGTEPSWNAGRAERLFGLQSLDSANRPGLGRPYDVAPDLLQTMEEIKAITGGFQDRLVADLLGDVRKAEETADNLKRWRARGCSIA